MDELIVLGDVTVGLIHRFNNNLNAIMLQAALLRHKGGPELTAEIEVIRSTTMDCAALLRPLIGLREQRRQRIETVCLMDLFAELDPRVTVSAADLPPVRTIREDLLRLLRYLVALTPPGPLPVRILPTEDEVVITWPFIDGLVGEEEMQVHDLHRLGVRALVGHLGLELRTDHEGALELAFSLTALR
jgi:hypothetical protein